MNRCSTSLITISLLARLVINQVVQWPKCGDSPRFHHYLLGDLSKAIAMYQTYRLVLPGLCLQPECLPTFFLTFTNLELGVLGKHLIAYHVVELNVQVTDSRTQSLLCLKDNICISLQKLSNHHHKSLATSNQLGVCGGRSWGFS